MQSFHPKTEIPPPEEEPLLKVEANRECYGASDESDVTAEWDADHDWYDDRGEGQEKVNEISEQIEIVVPPPAVPLSLSKPSPNGSCTSAMFETAQEWPNLSREIHEKVIKKSNENETVVPPPSPSSPRPNGCWTTAIPQMLYIRKAGDLLQVPSGQVARIFSTTVNILTWKGYSDPWRGPDQLLRPEYDGSWLFSDGNHASYVSGTFSFAHLHTPDWLKRGTVSKIRDLFGHVRICIIIQGVAVAMDGVQTAAYRLIKATDEEEALCQMFASLWNGLSCISVFLSVTPKNFYAPKSNRDLGEICSEFDLMWHMDDANERHVLY